MDHHKGQGEVGLGIEAETILFALVKSDSICDTGHRGPLPKTSSIFCWRSTAMTWPLSPTIFAIAIEQKPMPQPTSIAVMPGPT